MMSPKGLVKRRFVRLARWIEPLIPQGEVLAPILLYHGVDRQARLGHVSVEAFEQQMELLRRDWTPVSLVELVEAVSAGSWPVGRRPPVAVTFDDGYRNLVRHALPVLRDLGIRATVFVVTGRLGDRATWEGGEAGRASRLATEDEVRELLEAGFEVGGHGRTHLDLTECTESQLEDEIRGCVLDLERMFGEGEYVFAYPWARFNSVVVRKVRAAGYFAAVAGGWARWQSASERYCLRRLCVDATDDIDTFRAKLSGGWGWWAARWWGRLA